MKNNIKQIFKDKKLTYIDFCNKTGVARSSIGNIANGKRVGSLSTLLKIADYLDVSLDELVGRKPYIKKEEIDERLRGIQGAIEDAMKRNKNAQK